MELTDGDGAGDKRSRETGLMADVNQRDALTTYASSDVIVKVDGAHEAMLSEGKKPVVSAQQAKSDEYEALQSFLRSISSTATLPPYVKGETYSSKRGVFNQCLITCAVLILAAGAGHPIGFSAVALPQLRTENTSLHIDDEMGSWIGEFMAIGCF
ncbi:unnamed protein product [Plutella xylostella]|uniref:(diamondback moth) hypothetical protein n=1 Tax=Plutella xylostella TaxID=51655 RepID=A0A8S4FB00_PLUXY|nr:unnamed protein product [Plutella xylostella]